MLPQLYHAHHNRYLEDVPFWLELAAQVGGPILELGCGTGRVLIPMVRAGFQTLGIDNDRPMLNFLQARITGITPVPWIVEADIRKFNLACRFPLIILPCNTLSTLSESERLACLGCVRKHLRPGGIFAFSIPNPEYMMDLPARSEPEIEDEFIHPQTGNPVQVSSGWRRTKNIFKVTWIYDHLLPDGNVQRLRVETTHHLLPTDAWKEELRGAGMRLIASYGDFDRSNNRKDLPYLICVITL